MVERQGGAEDGGGVAGVALVAELAGAAEIGPADEILMRRRRLGLVELLGQLQALLKPPLLHRPFGAAAQGGRRHRGCGLVVLLLWQGDFSHGRRAPGSRLRILLLLIHYTKGSRPAPPRQLAKRTGKKSRSVLDGNGRVWFRQRGRKNDCSPKTPGKRLGRHLVFLAYRL